MSDLFTQNTCTCSYMFVVIIAACLSHFYLSVTIYQYFHTQWWKINFKEDRLITKLQNMLLTYQYVVHLFLLFISCVKKIIRWMQAKYLHLIFRLSICLCYEYLSWLRKLFSYSLQGYGVSALIVLLKI